MFTSLLFHESPLIAGTLLLAIAGSAYAASHMITITLSVVLLALVLFYRHYPIGTSFSDDQVVCPCDGTITDVIDLDDSVCVSVFLSVFDVHTQVYPVNGTVIQREYDHTGQFEPVVLRDKSHNNEKYIHVIEMANGCGRAVVVQIAGLLPRRIEAENTVPLNVLAGEYLGIIKFGSRVELILPKFGLDRLLIQEGTTIQKGQPVARYSL